MKEQERSAFLSFFAFSWFRTIEKVHVQSLRAGKLVPQYVWITCMAMPDS